MASEEAPFPGQLLIVHQGQYPALQDVLQTVSTANQAQSVLRNRIPVATAEQHPFLPQDQLLSHHQVRVHLFPGGQHLKFQPGPHQGRHITRREQRQEHPDHHPGTPVHQAAKAAGIQAVVPFPKRVKNRKILKAVIIPAEDKSVVI
jgi:hypothetical protein